MALVIALLSSACFAVAMVTARVGLRTLDARSGAALSIPTATLLFVLAAPFALDPTGFDVQAVLLFAAVGLVFPVSVTLLTFKSNELLGPTVASALSGTAPLFALLAASVFLGEQVPPQATVCALGVVAGVALLSWKKGDVRSGFIGWALLWPLGGAVMRAFAQTGAKAGLMLWSNAFAAGLVGYLVSCTVVIFASRVRGAAHRRKPSRRDIAWFAGTGVLNGGGVLLMYFALSLAPVWVVAPIIASYPLLTAIISTAVLHDDKLTLQAAAGGGLTIAAIVYLLVSQAPG